MNPEESQPAAGALHLFPMNRRSARLKAVASCLYRAPSDAAADQFAGQVADTLFAELAALGLAEGEQEEAVGAFFHEVGELVIEMQSAEPACAEIISIR